MLKIFGVIVSFFLMLIIFVRTPEDSAGLSGFAANDLFGSPRSSRQFLDSFTAVGVLFYLIIAFKLNFASN